MVLEATVLPTEPQPLPVAYIVLIYDCTDLLAHAKDRVAVDKA